MPEEEQEEPSKFDQWVEKRFGSEAAEKLIVAIAVVLGIGLSIGLFILLPTILAGFLSGFVQSAIVKNLIEGALRIVIS